MKSKVAQRQCDHRGRNKFDVTQGKGVSALGKHIKDTAEKIPADSLKGQSKSRQDDKAWQKILARKE